MQTVGAGIIAWNSERTIKNCIDSVLAHIDQCVVAVGADSSDRTEEIIKSFGGKVELHHVPEIQEPQWVKDILGNWKGTSNFSVNRNFCFSKLKTDWLLWVDSDDIVLQPENLKVIANSASPQMGCVWFPYYYASDEFDNRTTVYERERLLRASQGWIWRSRLHETVSPLTPCEYVRTDEVIIKHAHQQGGDTRKDRNFRILEIMLREDPADKRVWLYLGHQNFACGNWLKASEWYLKFGTDKGALPLERYQALCYCSKAMREMRDEQAIEVALMALELYPQYKDAYMELAQSYLYFGSYDKAIHFAKMVDIKDPILTEPPSIIFINPLEYTFNKFALLAECYLRKNDLQTSKDYLMQAYKIRPVKEIENNIRLIDNSMRKDRIVDGIRALSVELLATKELVRLPSLLAAIPYWYRETPEYAQIRQGIGIHTRNIEDKPEIIEGDNTIVNIGNSLNPEKLLADLDEKHNHITVIAPLPLPESKQVNSYCQRDIEELLMSRPNRSLINLQVEPTRIICEYDHRKLDGLAVRFYVGQGLEYWSPKTIAEQGCGGSETSAALLAKSLAGKGCQSIIYAMDDQTWDRVIYRPYNQFNPASIQSHLFISSRVPDVFDAEIPSLQKWLWAHDICFWDRLTPERAEKIDCIIALSHWHVEHLKRCYPFLKDAEVIDMDDQEMTYEDNWTVGTYYKDDTISRVPKIAIIGDAIDTSRFKGFKEKRVPYRFIWCSSPDRGLEELLNMWALLKKNLAEATLKIFYGWEYFDSSLHIPAQRELKQRIRQLIQQEGIEWCGRIGQSELAHELKQADAIIYPPHSFRETYGIAFLEAQAAGVMCFYRENGALGETIGDRGIPLSMGLTPEQIVKIVSETLQDRGKCGIIREKAKKYGRKRDWESQADKILSLYRRLEDGCKK